MDTLTTDRSASAFMLFRNVMLPAWALVGLLFFTGCIIADLDDDDDDFGNNDIVAHETFSIDVGVTTQISIRLEAINGNVQIFDNGMHRPDAMSYSRIVELDPSDSSIVWEYAAQPREQFFSGHISSAERQSNGNTLICEGTSGRVFEVTSRGEVVWDGQEPRGAPGRGRFLPCDLPEPAKPQGRFVSGFDPASGALTS